MPNPTKKAKSFEERLSEHGRLIHRMIQTFEGFNNFVLEHIAMRDLLIEKGLVTRDELQLQIEKIIEEGNEKSNANADSQNPQASDIQSEGLHTLAGSGGFQRPTILSDQSSGTNLAR